jgi:Leucine-rich repeat (LRR) protein
MGLSAMRIPAIFYCLSSSPPLPKIYKTSVGWKDKQEIYAALTIWANEGGVGERRDLAFRKIENCFKNKTDSLDFSGLHLRELPALMPSTVTKINAQRNKLTHLPATLPESLEYLDVTQNDLQDLPGVLPASLESLLVGSNRLDYLPDYLPPPLTNLSCYQNNLTQLPPTLPNLENLDLRGNQLDRLPFSLPATLGNLRLDENLFSEFPAAVAWLPDSCLVNLKMNPFPDETVASVRESISAPDYAGPLILIGDSAPQETHEEPIAVFISSWFPKDLQADAMSTWRSFENEDGAEAFFEFMQGLSGKPLEQHPEFKSHLGEWLSQLVERPALRSLSFGIAVAESASCTDRLLSELNQMQRAYVQDDVERGLYDGNIPELIAVGREEFRQRALEVIAGEKMKHLSRPEIVASRGKPDEIEVYLGYQVKLREVLQLKSLARDMRYFRSAKLTDYDLKVAESTVKEKEDEEFPEWLACWPVWDAVLQRVNAENFDLAQDKLMEESGEPLQEKIKSEREILNRPFCAVTYQRVSKRVWDEIVSVEKMKLTSAFLKENGLAKALEPFWEEITSL